MYTGIVKPNKGLVEDKMAANLIESNTVQTKFPPWYENMVQHMD